MKTPPAIIAIDVIHPTCDPVRHAQSSRSVNPSIKKIAPMINRSIFPRESMLQVKGMGVCYREKVRVASCGQSGQWPVASGQKGARYY